MKTKHGTFQSKTHGVLGGFAVRATVVVFTAAIFSLSLAGCGGGNPKSLAKETYDISTQALAAMLNPQKAEELEKKIDLIQKKVEKLSEKDKAIYTEELARLSGEGLGGLFKAAGGLLDANQAVNDALDASNQAVNEALDASNQAMNDALKQSENALKSLGF